MKQLTFAFGAGGSGAFRAFLAGACAAAVALALSFAGCTKVDAGDPASAGSGAATAAATVSDSTAAPASGAGATATAASATGTSAGFDAATFRKPSEDVLRARLTPVQFEVTQEDETEPPFRNLYWDEHRPGIYVDVVSGEPLFSSLDKFDSGTGWPSFTKPLDPANVAVHTDYKLILPRTEVRSKHADSHLGHVFDDGPAPTGKRYCMNSASLRFIPADELAAKGYGKYASLFAATAKGSSGTASASSTGATAAAVAVPGTRDEP